ncbi:MAG TPA: excinuclease ABC subunit UvrA [Thiobacillaceae bacterium]|nr:excinuclease ABC subunit UvrA [Thiobacillaceae bacterium]HNU65180.1 excinuclease ABC subunit UvrA [Thiobacillaceae bacterium]
MIRVRGARTHNLKNVHVDLPHHRLVVITGLSGSGKSSLAFDTLYAEGQRRYVESLSAYARQFLQRMEKPDVDQIEGLSPAISIEQKATSHNPRSTVGTVTEIHDYLRLLFARAGTPRCPRHGIELAAQTVSQMVDAVLQLPEDTRLMVLAPLVVGRKGEQLGLIDELRAQGFVRLRVDGEVHDIDAVPALEKNRKHTIEAVVDRLRARADVQQRLAESFETALRHADGKALVVQMDADPMDPGREMLFSARFACPVCDYALPELEPRLFSFNNPMGACPRCDGLGQISFFDPERVVAFPHLSLASGAIKGWDRRNAFFYRMLESLALHYGFDIDTPWEDLPEAIRHIILQGSGREEIAFQYLGESGRRTTRRHRFDGVIPSLERRYRESESQLMREELAKLIATRACPECEGSRLRLEARHVTLGGATLHQLSRLPIRQSLEFFGGLRLSGNRAQVAEKIVKEIVSRLSFLNNVGLDYLSLERSADTLSGGEAQRIRLASQIGSGLTGVMYVLDEPSIGLHQRDNDRLLGTLKHLRDLGNTVIVVEHDEDAIRHADHIVDMGPGAGEHGGEIVAQGRLEDILANPDSLTGQYLSGARSIPVPAARRSARAGRVLRLVNATGNNLKNVTLELPTGIFVCVTGVSGSGKSTLVNDTLYAATANLLNGAAQEPAPYEAIDGTEYFDKVVNVDQAPIGRTPRSNPATYTGLFTPIRELFAGTPAARERGYEVGRFSFNVKGGRCEACQGDGMIKVEMHFLPDIYVPCDVCHGQRYNRETLDVRYKGSNIHEVLQMTVEDALEFFTAVPVVRRKLQTLMDVGLAYIRLGQPATTLSGGEAQRVKLALELSKRDTGRTLYILDEPTTGLHFADIDLLLRVLHRLVGHGNTVVVIEHNLDVVKTADWIIDLGPEGGEGGGRIIAQGTPEQVAANPESHTGRYLRPVLARGKA